MFLACLLHIFIILTGYHEFVFPSILTYLSPLFASILFYFSLLIVLSSVCVCVCVSASHGPNTLVTFESRQASRLLLPRLLPLVSRLSGRFSAHPSAVCVGMKNSYIFYKHLANCYRKSLHTHTCAWCMHTRIQHMLTTRSPSLCFLFDSSAASTCRQLL